MAAAYQCLGQHLGAKKPKIEEKYYNYKTTPSDQPQSQIKLTTQPQQTNHSGANKTQKVAHITAIQTQTNQDDPEIQELVQQILENYDQPSAKPTKTAPTTSANETPNQQKTETSPHNNETTIKPHRVPRTNIIRLCLCSDPQCQAKQGHRPTRNEEMPPIAYVQTDGKKTTKTIQIQFDEYVPIHWEANAAYIKCHSNGTSIKSLIDTGSVISIISDEKARQISSQPEWNETGGIWDRTVNIKAYGCTNTQLDLIGRITIPQFRLKYNQQLPNNVSFWVLRNSSEECIISGEWLSTMKATLSMPHKLLYYSIPKTHLSAGGDQYVTTEIISTTPLTEPPQQMDIVPQDIQQIQEQLKEKQPNIPANQHYSITLGPTKKLSKPELTLLIEELPAKTSIKQNKIMLHIANTTPYDRQLSENSKITQTPQPIKMQTRRSFQANAKQEISLSKGHPVLIINTHQHNPELMFGINANYEHGLFPKNAVCNIPTHAQIDNAEYLKINKHIETVEQQATETEKTPTKTQDPPKENIHILNELQKMQAKFDFKEHMDPKLLPIQENKITLTEYPTLGELPFTEKTDKLTIFLCYLLLSISHSLDLHNLTTPQLDTTLQDFQDKTAKTIKHKIDKAYNSHNINKIYQALPLQICHQLHIDLTTTFDNVNRIDQTQLPTRQKNSTKKAMYGRLMIKTQALSTLMYYTQSLIRDLARTYGQHPYFYHKTISLPTYTELPAEIDNIPPQMLHQIIQQQNQAARVPTNKMTRIKNQTDFQNFILPLATPYTDREYSFNEFKNETLLKYDQLNQAAKQQATPPKNNNIHKTLTIDQLQTPQEKEDYIQYATSPSALYNFMKEQLPPSTDDVIPIGKFLNSLHRAKLVIYQNPEQAIQDFIPHQLRPQFDQFFRMFRDPHFITTSKQLRLPDYPQIHVWGTPHPWSETQCC